VEKAGLTAEAQSTQRFSFQLSCPRSPRLGGELSETSCPSCASWL